MVNHISNEIFTSSEFFRGVHAGAWHDVSMTWTFSDGGIPVAMGPCSFSDG